MGELIRSDGQPIEPPIDVAPGTAPIVDLMPGAIVRITQEGQGKNGVLRYPAGGRYIIVELEKWQRLLLTAAQSEAEPEDGPSRRARRIQARRDRRN